MLNCLADANTRAVVTEVRLAVLDTVPGLPFVFELLLTSTGGTGTATPPTAQQSRGWPAFTSPFTVTWNLTAEPTVTSVMRRFRVPIGAAFVVQFPLGREPALDAVSHGFAIRCTNPTGGATLTATNGGIDVGMEIEIA